MSTSYSDLMHYNMVSMCVHKYKNLQRGNQPWLPYNVRQEATDLDCPITTILQIMTTGHLGCSNQMISGSVYIHEYAGIPLNIWSEKDGHIQLLSGCLCNYQKQTFDNHCLCNLPPTGVTSLGCCQSIAVPDIPTQFGCFLAISELSVGQHFSLEWWC